MARPVRKGDFRLAAAGGRTWTDDLQIRALGTTTQVADAATNMTSRPIVLSSACAPRASGASILDGRTTRILAGQRASGLLHNGNKTDRSFDAVISPATAVMALK